MNGRFAEDETRWAIWMACAQRGDQARYAQLLQQVAGAIEAYVRARFGPIDSIEDCVQECLVALHTARHTYDPSRPFRPWLFTIVRHKTIDLLRQRATWLSAQQSEECVDASHSDTDRVTRVLDGIRLLAQLSPDHRTMIALAKYGGYSTAEAATALGISESAAKARLQRALLAIREALVNEELAL
jgi:RNA polymerase sigma-70 factor (ECF subfamily)